MKTKKSLTKVALVGIGISLILIGVKTSLGGKLLALLAMIVFVISLLHSLRVKQKMTDK